MPDTKPGKGFIPETEYAANLARDNASAIAELRVQNTSLRLVVMDLCYMMRDVVRNCRDVGAREEYEAALNGHMESVGEWDE